MKNPIYLFFALVAMILLSSCGILGKKKKSGALPNDGQVYGIAPGSKYTLPRPPGMVYIPQGTFHMGPSDEDPSYSFSARNRAISISGFWMDATEITNNEYRQFVWWVRDSVAATELKYLKPGKDGKEYVDWAKMKTLKWNDPKVLEELGQTKLILPPDDRIFGKMEINPNEIVYQVERFDLKEAAKRENAGIPRSKFIDRYPVRVYPDTLVWIRDFAYSYNEPMTKRYFSHPSFGNYPVVGVNWKQADAFCNWRTLYLNTFLNSKNRAQESDFRLPTEAQWEYAARGGRSQSMFPWGNYYTRNKKGCLMANFKPGRGNYPEDGGFYTVRADAYWPNDFGLYNMSGNVAEWTSSIFYEGGFTFQHDMNPDVRWNAKDTDSPLMKRKVIRGGSWKDVSYYLQTGTRTYEYQDTAKSYIGFRSVIDLPAAPEKGRRGG
ncbi:MAG: SUMF1/EgtB/PvdO family nonheme iron enzyme [Chitinophagaceae bacterium]|nr:SUMF1/EgtB/PvdO family nonheme iron enzyme [Chitinophagaceae bacterium]MBN8668981.1 SUMF1/EgtB/PvdO family nonheme iron enzyme [Chitinophagales bacterium]